MHLKTFCPSNPLKNEKQTMFGIIDHLNIAICRDVDDAIAQGYVYRSPMKPLNVAKVVVVRNGCESGRVTVDFLCADEQGGQYHFMITSRLLQSIPCSEGTEADLNEKFAFQIGLGERGKGPFVYGNEDGIDSVQNLIIEHIQLLGERDELRDRVIELESSLNK